MDSSLEIKKLKKEIKTLRAKLRQANGKDKLTGLVSKSGMYKKLSHAFATLRRESRNLGSRSPSHFSLIFIDIDGFKPINDGNHLRGDRILIEFGVFLKKITREVDTVARFGGDEFFILAPGSNLAQAGILCEKIQEGVESYIFDAGCGGVILGCSIGIASTSEGFQTTEELISLADVRMQDKKNVQKRHLYA